MKADPRGRVVRPGPPAGGQGQPARRRHLRAGALTGAPGLRRHPGRRAARPGRHRRVRPRAGRGRHPPGRAGRPGPPAGPLAGRRVGRRAGRARCSRPARPRDPDFLDRLRDLAPGLRAGRRVRRAGPARRPGDPQARLGQPALLAAAGLARRGAGAARRPARRRGHRRERVPARGRSRHRPGLRHADRADPARRHRRRPAGPARRRRAPGLLVAVLDAIEAGTARAAPQPADGVTHRARRSPSRTRGSAGTTRRSRSIGASAPARRPRAPGRRCATNGSSSARSARSRTGRGWPAGDLWSNAARCWPARRPRRWCSARCGRPARRRWRPPTGRAACASSRRSGWHDGGRSRSGPPRRPAARVRPAARARRSRIPAGGGPRRPHRPRAPRRPAAVDPARQAAYEAIAAVHRDDAYANLALREILRGMRLHGRDAAFATELTYGTLRSLGTLDAIVAAVAGAGRGPDRPADPRRAAARGVPAAVHPGAGARRGRPDRRPGPGGGAGRDRLRQRGDARHRRDRSGRLAGRLAPGYDADPVGHLAVVHNHPEWIVRAFAEALGGDLEETARLLIEDNQPPAGAPVRPTRPDRRGRARRRGGRRSGRLLAVRGLPARRRPGRPRRRARRAGARAGRGFASWWRPRCRRRRSTAGTRRWLDLCAGPGGKAGLLGCARRAARRRGHRGRGGRAPGPAGRARHRGAAGDSAAADGRAVGRDPDLPEESFDRVLVDAPCTGLGSLRRRPEARWRRQPSDLPPLTRLQRELLVAALRAVRPGGVVAYVTCSPHRGRDAGVGGRGRPAQSASAWTSSTRDRCCRRACPGWATDPTVQLWPHRHGTDAMFLAVLRRT